MLEINIFGNIPDSFQMNEDEIKETATAVLDTLDISGKFEIEVIFCDEDEIRKLNLEHRQIDKPTDILSFPQEQFDSTKETLSMLGSIVICGKIALERDEKLEELIKHGMLHLLGYDHDSKERDWDIVAQKINCNF